ncbi:uncharacterized protein LOC144125176 [Amblyomma americanum]
MKEFRVPRSGNDVQSFLALCSYIRPFVPGYAAIARPLCDRLKKDMASTWGPLQENAFAAVISKLTTSPVLAHFDVVVPTEVRTDASAHGIGPVLSRRQSGSDRVIAYASRPTE